MSSPGHHSPATANPAIAVEINAATKKLHTELNKLIVERLPYALPPHTQSPARYGTGVSRFAAIFFAFEEAFAAVREKSLEEKDSHGATVQQWVATLLPPGLERTKRLKADLQHLREVSKASIDTESVQDERMRMRSSVQSKPHLLVAYAWIMYMAIFSGGRWIRQQLASAGDDFWVATKDEKQSLDVPGFTFLSFDEEKDGENFKVAFKKRLDAADDLLTVEERQDIVNTGQEVFQHCIDLIERIDRDVWWLESTTQWPLALAVLGLGLAWLIWRILTGQSILTAD